MATPINQSIVSGFELLRAVLRSPAPSGSRQLARDLDMDQAKVVRLTKTLCSIGLLRRTAEGRYRPGPGLHVLAGQALIGSGLIAAALPVLEDLHRDGWTVALGVLWEDAICYLVHARRDEELIDRIGVHHLAPVEVSSLGQVLMAQDPRQKVLGLTRTQCRAVRERGHARIDFDNGETSLAVPIGSDPPVAAIGVSRPRLGARQATRVLARLAAAATAIHERIERDDRTDREPSAAVVPPRRV